MGKNISHPLDWWGLPSSMKENVQQHYNIWKTTLPDNHNVEFDYTAFKYTAFNLVSGSLLCLKTNRSQRTKNNKK